MLLFFFESSTLNLYFFGRCVARNPKTPSRKGDLFYGCHKGITDKCKSFLFWAPKDKKVVDSTQYMGK